MSHRSIARIATRKGTALALVASAALYVGSPLVTVSSADPAGVVGAQTQVGPTFGDCKNDNNGVHNGYQCPPGVQNTSGTADGSGTSTGSGSALPILNS